MSILSPFQINSSSQDGAQFEPAVTVLSDGRMIVVWRTIAWHYDPTQTTAQYEIAYRVLNADGSFAGPDGILSGFSAQSQTNPAITELSNGNVVVSWDTVAEVDPDVGPTADINHAVFDVCSDGTMTPISPIRTSNANIVSAQLSSDIVALETGGYLMVWKSYDSDNSNPFSGYDIVLREFDADGDPAGPEQTLISGDNKYDHEPEIAGLPNGNIVVSWHNSNSNYTDNGVSEIVMEVYDTTGYQVAGHTILMTDSNRTVARNVDIAVDPTTGGYMLVFEYFDYDQPNYNLDIFAREYNANGQPLAQPFKLHPDDNVDQSFAAATYLGDGTFVAAWRSKVNQGPGFFEMQGTILKPDGSVVNFTFSDKIEYGSAELEIVATADGGFMAVWNGLGDFNTEVFGQRFDANGNPQPQVVPISVIDPDQNLRGTASHDVIDGGSGNDTIKSLKGNDQLNGHDGDDLIIGGRGWDRITGGEGNDKIEGRQGPDRIDGDAGDDHIKGGRGNDQLSGSEGHDTIFGGRGNDVMTGGADNDRLSGGRGHDKVYGGTGEDVINGGKGRDILFGGADSDTFIFQKGNRVDIVKDFNIAEDQIAVSSEFFGVNEDIEMSILNALDFSQSQGWLEIQFGADRFRLNIEDADDFYDPIDQGLNWGEQLLAHIDGSVY